MAKKRALEVDYIVVGGGSAGSTVASRLSEDPTLSVSLVEIGKRNDSRLVRWPAGYAKLQNEHNRFEWLTTPQRHLNGRRLPTPQAKVLGGGSTINGMVYIRGNRRDYDWWAELGNDLWSFDEVLPYFRKSEGNGRLLNLHHNSDGPLGVNDQRYSSELTRLFILAGQEVGHPYNPDFNGDSQSGVGLYQVTQRAGERCSAARAFLYDNLHRENLDLVTDARVTRLIIENRRAVGIEIQRAGEILTETIRANREVIISSGTINSAKLLLLSGIGPADELKALGIEPTLDLPGVGKNLQDHLDAYTGISLNAPLSYADQDKGLRAIRHGLEYLALGTGLINSNICEGGLFLSTTGDASWPDIQMHFIPAQLAMHKAGDGHGVTLTTAYVRPKSRGQVTLASANPADEPIVDPNFLSEPSDIEHSIDGVEAAREVLHARALRGVFKAETFPGPTVRSRGDVAAYVREVAKTDFHPVGTCKMGTDPMAVVDQQLRVHGMLGLRVVDASVMPAITTGNTNAPSIMIGERAADFIRKT